MADQHGIRAVGIQRAVSFKSEVVRADQRTALQWQGLRKVHGLRGGNKDGFFRHGSISWTLKTLDRRRRTTGRNKKTRHRKRRVRVVMAQDDRL